jgi:riboflavin synthase
MFTGLIEEVGTVRSLDAGAGTGSLTIGCSVVTEGTSIGDSIAVNGVCLTVTALPGDGFVVEVMGETFDRSSIGGLSAGQGVNLERAMMAGDRLGGHMVQGHVDGVGEILSIDPQGEWTTVTYRLPADLARYVVEKGSITVDGTSLTVMAVDEGTFSVGLIPHTMAVTTHGARAVGDRVNLEVDVIAKYVERQLTAGATSPYTTTSTASASA